MIEELMGRISNTLTDSMLEKLLKTDYSKNTFNMVTAAQKLTVKAFLEACIRAETGKALARPLGSPNVQSPWDKIFLNPTQLFSLPTKDGVIINTGVVIGENAKKPLKLRTPIMISAMSYGGSLSLKAKVALAKGATMAGTATNTGESALIDEERSAAETLIGQYNRYEVMNTKEQISRLDAIEVQLGQGAWGGAVPSIVYSDKIGEHFRRSWHLKEGEDAKRGSRLRGVDTPEEIINLLNRLKKEYDIPVGVKIAGSHFIEKELDVLMKTDIDFIVIDGSEGGTAGATPTLEDNVGLPTLYALSRAAKYLESKGMKNKYDLIVAGGLKTPGDFLKAISLGAKAVYIASIALVAMMQDQMVKAIPELPVPQVVLYDGKLSDELDVDRGAENLSKFLNSCLDEIRSVLIALGKDDISQLSRNDLVSVDKELSEALAIAYAGDSL